MIKLPKIQPTKLVFIISFLVLGVVFLSAANRTGKDILLNPEAVSCEVTGCGTYKEGGYGYPYMWYESLPHLGTKTKDVWESFPNSEYPEKGFVSHYSVPYVISKPRGVLPGALAIDLFIAGVLAALVTVVFVVLRNLAFDNKLAFKNK